MKTKREAFPQTESNRAAFTRRFSEDLRDGWTISSALDLQMSGTLPRIEREALTEAIAARLRLGGAR